MANSFIKIYPEAPEQSRMHLEAIQREISKSWYKKPEVWFSLIAAITSVISLILMWLWKKI